MVGLPKALKVVAACELRSLQIGDVWLSSLGGSFLHDIELSLVVLEADIDVLLFA
jgi:hypothetical protein